MRLNFGSAQGRLQPWVGCAYDIPSRLQPAALPNQCRPYGARIPYNPYPGLVRPGLRLWRPSGSRLGHGTTRRVTKSSAVPGGLGFLLQPHPPLKTCPERSRMGGGLSPFAPEALGMRQVCPAGRESHIVGQRWGHITIVSHCGTDGGHITRVPQAEKQIPRLLASLVARDDNLENAREILSVSYRPRSGTNLRIGPTL